MCAVCRAKLIQGRSPVVFLPDKKLDIFEEGRVYVCCLYVFMPWARIATTSSSAACSGAVTPLQPLPSAISTSAI